jgi:hypothetical protein
VLLGCAQKVIIKFGSLSAFLYFKLILSWSMLQSICAFGFQTTGAMSINFIEIEAKFFMLSARNL